MFQPGVGLLKLLDHRSKAHDFFGFHLFHNRTFYIFDDNGPCIVNGFTQDSVFVSVFLILYFLPQALPCVHPDTAPCRRWTLPCSSPAVILMMVEVWW